MRKKILLVTTLVIVMVMILAGCNTTTVESYSRPLLDLSEKVIKTGGVGELKDEAYKSFDEVLYTFGADIVGDGKENVGDPKYNYMFNHETVVADEKDFGKDYMAHPDSILLRRKAKDATEFAFTKEILTVFPLGHGKGAVKGKISPDGGMTYPKEGILTNTPKSWERSQETPTIYRLTFNENNVPDDDDLLVLIGGNPYWSGDSNYKKNGFNVSISAPSLDKATGDMVEGREWSEFETWYGHGKDGGDAIVRNPKGSMKAHDCIVAMSSLTRLKDPVTHAWTNRWMGLFHDHNFNCYKTILSFREPTAEEKNPNYRFPILEADGTDSGFKCMYPTYMVEGTPMIMEWAEPVKYFAEYRKIERKSNMCEVECVRSDRGEGNELALITRSNSKKMNSLVTFSTDEGETWSAPREVPAILSGERHKAEWVKDDKGNDKLFITFRSIERDSVKPVKYSEGRDWMSEGYVAWLGSWDDLKNGREGDFRVKLLHTYLGGQTAPSRGANGDTGYCGNVVMDGGTKVATCSYGRFSPNNVFVNASGKPETRTYIAGRVLDIPALYELVAMKDAQPAA